MHNKEDNSQIMLDLSGFSFEEDDKCEGVVKEITPKMPDKDDIYISLGSPWVPEWVIDQFIMHLFGKSSLKSYYVYFIKQVKNEFTKHDPLTGIWEIRNKFLFKNSVATTETYGTRRMDAIEILEKSLNMKTVCVMDTVRCDTNKSGKARVINKEETVAALEKQKKIKDEFVKWVWTDKKRSQELERIYREKYVGARRYFDGSRLELNGLNSSTSLYPYQKDAVARILLSANTLLAHDVGSGKTYVMIAAGMELKRRGLSDKNLYVVPNNILGQWENIFRTMYPEADLFIVDNKIFTKDKREETLRKIKKGGYDAVIMTYSCFDRIPLSKKYLVSDLKQQKKALIDTSKTSGSLRRYNEMSRKLGELVASEDTTKGHVCFDELGITRLFVDEAHNYKNVPVETSVSNVLGISSSGSKKCQGMLDKVKCVQKQNFGKGVVMATGTPITNSITDVYVMQLYLQSGELKFMDIESFDGWLGMFAEPVTNFEIDVDTNSYRLATRFSQFHNLPELTTLLSSIADFHGLDTGNGIPEMNGYTDTLIPKTKEFNRYLSDISKRAEKVRAHKVNRREDNMLKITTDGRLAALDMRLVDSDADFNEISKVYECAKKVAEIYRNTGDSKGSQLVFCDSSTPKTTFNIYDELRRLLISEGIRDDEIAYIHSATTERKRQMLFKDVRSGKVRVLIGSTFKLGLGVNVQDRLIALHHLDIPWRPADMVQREGRILRQGNTNDEVYIYRYITEGSFDAYTWQLLETKQRFITDLLSGYIKERSGRDVDDTVLNYAEVKALAVGNPLIKKRVETANELTRFITLQRKTVEKRERLSMELNTLPDSIDKQKKLVADCEEDVKHSTQWSAENPDGMSKEEREAYVKLMSEALEKYIQDKDKFVMEYKGFNIILPAHWETKKPVMRISHAGTYDVERSESAKGNLTRIDNFISGLNDRLNDYRNGLMKFEMRLKDVEEELRKHEDYSGKITSIENSLRKIDEELGVKAV